MIHYTLYIYLSSYNYNVQFICYAILKSKLILNRLKFNKFR